MNQAKAKFPMSFDMQGWINYGGFNTVDSHLGAGPNQVTVANTHTGTT